VKESFADRAIVPADRLTDEGLPLAIPGVAATATPTFAGVIGFDGASRWQQPIELVPNLVFAEGAGLRIFNLYGPTEQEVTAAGAKPPRTVAARDGRGSSASSSQAAMVACEGAYFLRTLASPEIVWRYRPGVDDRFLSWQTMTPPPSFAPPTPAWLACGAGALVASESAPPPPGGFNVTGLRLHRWKTTGGELPMVDVRLSSLGLDVLPAIAVASWLVAVEQVPSAFRKDGTLPMLRLAPGPVEQLSLTLPERAWAERLIVGEGADSLAVAWCDGDSGDCWLSRWPIETAAP